jgi:hypothetical protein
MPEVRMSPLSAIRVRTSRRRRPTCAGAAALALLLLVPVPAAAQLSEVEVASLRLVYFEGSESYLASHAARAFLTSMAFQKKLLGFDPDGKVTVLLVDFSDSGNASAGSVPRDSLNVQISPLSFAFETLAANERMTTIMNHELVHVATMDQAAGRDRFFRSLFQGKVAPVADQPETIAYFYLTAPRVAAPRWYHEGSAVFIDTWMAGGLGRAQSGYDEMVFRAMVRDGAHIYDPLGLASEGTKIDFQLQMNSYLYGARFMTYMARRYGPDKFVEWITRHPGSRASYSRQFKHVYGRPLETAWAEWIAAEREFQQANLAAIRTHPTTPYKDLSPRALGSVSRAFYDPTSKKVYAAFNYQGSVAHVGAISMETGAVEKIVDIKGPSIFTVTSIAYDPAGRTIFYTTDNNNYRDLVAVDPVTHHTTLLQKDARIGDLAFNRADKSLWGIRHLNGICSLVRIPQPYREWNRVVSFPYGLVPYDLDVSPDGRRVSASFGEISGRQSVRIFDVDKLLAGDSTPDQEFDFGGSTVPSNFTFSPDGQHLYGSSYFTGVSNIYRYSIATKETEALTNAETGFFRPIPLEGDELLVFRYSGQGFVPARLTGKKLEDLSAITFLGERTVEEHPELKTWMVPPPSDIPYDTLPKKIGNYHLAGGMGLESWYPVVQGYKDTAAVGARVNFSDPLQLNRVTLVGSYSPAADVESSERVHLKAEYQRYDWKLRAQLNNADFYDLVGPTKTGRKGYVLGVGYRHPLVYDEPITLNLELDGSYSGNLDRLPGYQNVEVDVTSLASAQAKLAYSNVRSSLGKVDDEKGVKASVVAAADYVDSRLVPGLYATADTGVALGGHASIWWRNAGGFSPENPDDPFANFYFGGFRNNWLDHGDEKRYRDFLSLPGAEIDEVAGRNFLKSMLELNLPPLRFSRVGVPDFYVTWMRPAVFVTGLLTNMDDTSRQRAVADIGAQLDFQFSLMGTLDMTLSLGAAVAVEHGRRLNRSPEFMLSVKVLR